MIKVNLQGQINPYLKSDVLFSAGTLVKLDPANAGKIVPANAGDTIIGIAAQDVVEANVDNFKLTSVTHKALKGEDNVGIYFNGGIFTTDNYTGTITQGDMLYVGANGVFTKTAPASGNTNAVAVALTGAVSYTTSINVPSYTAVRLQLLV